MILPHSCSDYRRVDLCGRKLGERVSLFPEGGSVLGSSSSLEDLVFGEEFLSIRADYVGSQVGVVCDPNHLLYLDGPEDIALVNGCA